MNTTFVKTGVEVGDIFVSSWGYDQTNISYYQVVGITASGKSVKVTQIAQKITEHGTQGTDVVFPVCNAFVDETVQTLKLHDVQWRENEKPYYAIKLSSFEHAYLYEGGGNTQTSWGWGH